MPPQLSFNVPANRTYEDTIRFLVHNQFPAVLESSIRHFQTLPEVNIYSKLTRQMIMVFKEALLRTTSREFTMSGIGSFIDYNRYGYQIKRPTPQYYNAGCTGNSLCMEPTCFGFSEGVIENNNMLQTLCWSLAMACLKDQYYSDSQFDRKIMSYLRMFFAQPAGVLEAFIRTNLQQESIKIVCTDKNFRYTGSLIGGSDGISLPFYINPNEPTAFPDIDAIPAGVGGANLDAFSRFLAPRLFSGTFEGGMKAVDIFGQQVDYEIAMEQTMSVQDKRSDTESVRSRLDRMFGPFTEDGMYPTFKQDADGVLEILTQEILQESTIAGLQQTTNPEHSLAKYRSLMFVPTNWRYQLVEPPKDDFSDLGLGAGLNFRANTPGVFPIMSSQMFANQTMDGTTVVLGQRVDSNGDVVASATGLRDRERPLQEAIRTRVEMTYAQQSCGAPGDLRNVGPAAVTQGEADGFNLKSKMYIGTDVRGTARPVELFFLTDTPRAAQPIIVCNEIEVDISSGGVLYLNGCCPGVAGAGVLTFTADGYAPAALAELVAATFTEGDVAVYRTGPRGTSQLVEIGVVSGTMVPIQAIDAEGAPDLTATIVCCSGVPDDYGVLGDLVVVTGSTATSSGIMRAGCDPDTGILTLELYDPIIASADANEATITLATGEVISVVYEAASDAGVFVTLVVAAGETCDLCALDCGCLVGATFAITAET